MGREWDRSGIAFAPATWAAVFRVLKPGAHLLAFGGARTAHRIACAIEDAGFEIRDSLEWLYGSGFPKSLNVSKAIDKQRKDEIRHVCRFLRSHMERAGVTSRALAERFGFHSRMVDHWAARDTDSQPSVPTVQQWESLRGALGFGPEMDAEVLRLNERKGEPGDTWKNAKIIGRYEPVRSPQESWFVSSVKDDTIREASDPAREWEGWGTALKPGHEPIILARKPLEGTVAANVLKYGTGALNIDACRVPHGSPEDLAAHEAQVAAIKARGGAMDNSWKNSSDLSGANDVRTEGRWPPNVLLTHSAACQVVGERAIKANPTWDTPNRNTEPSSFTGAEVSKVRHAAEVVPEYACAEDCPVRELDEQSGESASVARSELPTEPNLKNNVYGRGMGGYAKNQHSDSGTASRYFPQSQWNPKLDDVAPFLYVAKANRSERDRGLERFRRRSGGELTDRVENASGLHSPRAGAGRNGGMRNVHPTVKPVEVLAWLVRLVTPPRGVVVDPFCGSGSCGVATMLEGVRYIGIELNDTVKEPFVTMARARIEWVIGGGYAREVRPELAATDDDEPRQRSLF
jgi:hypothetical protein